MGNALQKVCDYDGDAMYLAHAAKVVRKEMFDGASFVFDGSFKGDMQSLIPKSLLAVVNILHGPNIENQAQLASSSAAISISQLLQFNLTKNT